MKGPSWSLFLSFLSPAPRALTRRAPSAAALVGRGLLSQARSSYSSRPAFAASPFDEPIDRKSCSSLKWNKYEDDVLPLWVADMDFRSPQCIIDAIQARAQHGTFGYTVPPPELKEEVVAYLHRMHNWKVDPSWIVWLHGLVPGLAVASHMAAEKEGDETMTAGMRVTSVPLLFDEAAQGWSMDYEAMERLVSEKTKMFILCNPHNPVGKVFSAEELRRLGDFCKRHGLVLCSDEIHCDLVLSPHKKHVALAALEDADLMARSIVLHAPSKTYNVPGLCCSYAVIPDTDLRNRFKKAARGFVTEINCVGYEACWAAYKYGEPWRRELIEYLRGNRDFAIEFIKTRIPDLRLYPAMDATYLMWIDARPLMEKVPRSSGITDPASFFLKEARVGLSDGRDFAGPGHVRLNLGCRREVLREALERMEAAVRSHIQ